MLKHLLWIMSACLLFLFTTFCHTIWGLFAIFFPFQFIIFCLRNWFLLYVLFEVRSVFWHNFRALEFRMYNISACKTCLLRIQLQDAEKWKDYTRAGDIKQLQWRIQFSSLWKQKYNYALNILYFDFWALLISQICDCTQPIENYPKWGP